MKLPLKKQRLGELLLEQRFLSQEDIHQALTENREGSDRLGMTLVKKGLLSEEGLAQALALQYSLTYYPLTHFRIDPDFFKMIPVELMYRHSFIPYQEQDRFLTVMIADPAHLGAMDELELVFKKELRLGISTQKAILDVLKRSEGSSHVLKKIEADFRPRFTREDESMEESLSVESLSRDASPVIKLVDTMILNALQKRASDIHIEATEKEMMVKYRIDGVLYPAMGPLGIQYHAPLVSRIKVMSELDISEKRLPQDGRFKMRIEERKVDFRISILPSIFGEDMVIRILDKESITTNVSELRLDKLGFNPNDLKRFRMSIIEPHGMVLVTGPTGSGKTTTLYAAISEINTAEEKIVTIEDPVEYELHNVVQIPVNEKKGLTFVNGLRSILRHDPDKIMVGEIRDLETAHIAIESALTGHLVFTTVHANHAFDVIGRFINMGIEPYHFISSLNCILAQRLVRMICLSCKQKVTISRELCENSMLSYEQYEMASFYQGKGCPECNGTGYKGRTAITELLDLSDEIREMILERRPSSEIRKAAIGEGLTTLRQSGLQKVFNGETTLREINRVTFIE
ncbi:MAG: Flp pilus assembly complex ATPase component TadA [Nitrospirae bacterium]|nr:Flp pilus assembly complex ATPase component TadA [Candidatus Troglogloeales bacterium]